MNIHRFLLTASFGITGVVACSNSNPSPAPPPSEVNPQGWGDCRTNGCPQDNYCKRNVCIYFGGAYQCQEQPNPDHYLDFCNDNAAHQLGVVQGHCDMAGNCSQYCVNGGGNIWYECNSGCSVTYNGTDYQCCQSGGLNCTATPAPDYNYCPSSSPPATCSITALCGCK